jgi:predicted enzyme related to lactoylglutathione lyase
MLLRRAILFAKDVERLTAFYRDALGLPFLPDRSQAGWAEFEGLALHALPAQPDLPDPAPRREDSWIKLVFATDDVAGTRERLAAHGARMDEPFRWEGGSYCDGVDPEGNVFQISSR